MIIVFILISIPIIIFIIAFFQETKKAKEQKIKDEIFLKAHQEWSKNNKIIEQRNQSNISLVQKELTKISNQNNYYEVLSVSPNADFLEIRTAFYQKISNLISPEDKDSKVLCIQALMVLTDYFVIDFFDLSFKDDLFNHINNIATREENNRQTKKDTAERIYRYSNNDNAIKKLEKARNQFYNTRPSSISMHSYVSIKPQFQLFDCHLIFNKSFKDLHDEHLSITQGYSKASTSVLLNAIKSKYNVTFNDLEPYLRLKDPTVKMGYLYLAEQKNHITPENTYLCKIGLTTTADPYKRVRSQQTVDLDVLYTAHFESIYEVENILHALYKKLYKHYNKEYFHLSIDDINWIKTLGSQDSYRLSQERKTQKEAMEQKKKDNYKEYLKKNPGKGRPVSRSYKTW